MLTLILGLEHVTLYNSYSQSQPSASAQACVCCHFAFYLYHIKIVFALLCMGWYHMRVQNSMSYFIIWKVIKCIFIIIKGRGRNIFVHIFIHVDNSQTLPLASRIILTTLPHFRFYRKPQLCEGLEKIRSCFLVCFFKYI